MCLMTRRCEKGAEGVEVEGQTEKQRDFSIFYWKICENLNENKP